MENVFEVCIRIWIYPVSDSVFATSTCYRQKWQDTFYRNEHFMTSTCYVIKNSILSVQCSGNLKSVLLVVRLENDTRNSLKCTEIKYYTNFFSYFCATVLKYIKNGKNTAAVRFCIYNSRIYQAISDLTKFNASNSFMHIMTVCRKAQDENSTNNEGCQSLLKVIMIRQL